MPNEGGSVDVQRLIAEVAARHNVILRPDDPAFALVTMNRLILDNAIGKVHDRIYETSAGFDASYQKAERRAGSVLAEEVKQAAALMRQDLQKDIHGAGLKAREYVHRVNEAHRRPALICWSAAGLMAGALLFGGGVWLGTVLR